jgi:hypothetical protein
MKTLIKAPTITRYSEIFQTVSLLFSFVRKETSGAKGEDVYTQLFQPVKCRDFLGDLIYSKKSGLSICIYGFNYSYKTHPYDEDMLRLSLTFPNKETYLNFKGNYHIIEEKERKYGIKMSTYYKTQDELSIIIEADPIWQSNTWKLSLFSYYLKLMCYPDVNKPEQPETQYAQKLTKEIEEKLLSKLNVMEEFPPEYPGISGAHNYSGFVSIISYGNSYTEAMNKLLLETP